jgi:subtilisin-like proprotein convertase family protein
MYFEDDGDNITGSDIRIYSSPEVGRVEVDEGTGDITFTASENDFGNRTFSYYACNSAGNCSQVANFTIVITPVNDPPSFGITNLTVLEDTIVSLNLPQDLNVTDPEDVLSADSFSVVTMPQVGMLEYAGGTLVYTPPLNYYTTANSPVSFVLMVCDRDNVQLCVNETISLILTPVSDAGAANSSLPQSSTIDNYAAEFYLTLIHPSLDALATLSVTTREQDPILFEVVAGTFRTVAAAVAGEFTNIPLVSSLGLLLEDSTQRDKGIYVRALASRNKIALYVTYSNSFQHDSSLILPTPPDTLQSYTYMVVARSDVPSNTASYVAALVATENDTTVEILPEIPIQIGSVSVAPGTGHTLTLQRLETLLIADQEDITGSRVVANKPLSFFNGHQYTRFTSDPLLDFHVEQIPPVEYWGSRFVLAAPSAIGGLTYRVISGLECTTVHISCSASLKSSAFVSSFSLNVSEFEDMDVVSGQVCWLESYYPVFVVQHPTGGVPPTGTSVIVPPVNQYSNVYVLSPQFPTVVLMVPSEHFQLDRIYLDGSALAVLSVSASPVVYKGTTRAYALELPALSGTAVTLYHSDPSATFGVLVYAFNDSASYAQLGGLHQAIWSGDNLFMLGISHLDESTVTINWLKPVDFVLSYNFTLMRNDVGVVEEGMTLEQSVSFSNLRQLTYYTLTVEAVVNSTLKLPLVNHTTFRTDPCPHSADIVFLVDASSSVSPQQFEIFKDFVANVSYGLKFGENWTRVGVITFGSGVHELVGLDWHFNGDSFRSEVENLTYAGSPPSLISAIGAAVSRFAGGFGARSDAVHLVILLTATAGDSSVEPAAQNAIQSGVTIYTVGVELGTADLLPTTRSDLTDESDDSRVYSIPAYEDLHSLSIEFGIKFSDCFCDPPCLNDGVCVKSLYCNCTDGWAGIACHTLDPTLFRFQKKSNPVGILEGSQDVYLVWLNRQIFSDVYLDIMSADNFSQVVTSRFVFNASNWMIPQDLEVLGVDDIIDREDVYASTLVVSTASTNKLYRSQDMVKIAVLDTDEPGIIVVPAEAYPDPRDIPEGRWRTYEITLPNKPTSPVVILFFPIDTTFISVFPTYMVFDPENWDSPQLLVVTATNDDIDRESPYSATLGMRLLSMDVNFHEAAVPELALTIEDNDYGDAVLSGSLSWRRVATATRRTAAQFTLTLTLSLDYHLNATAGDNINLPGRFYYGDDSSDTDLTLGVVEVVRDRGYFIVVGHFIHEYISSLGKLGPWKAWFEYCCRRGYLTNNRHTLLTIYALVNLHYQSSPVIPILPIIDFQVSHIIQVFHFVGKSRGNPLIYSLGEAYNYHSSQAGPPQGLTIDAVTGWLRWNTSLASPGHYSVHVVTQDLFSGVNVTTELLIRVQPAAGNSADSAPSFTSSSKRLPPLIHILEANESFSANVSATLPDYYDEDVTVLPLTLPPSGMQVFTTEVVWTEEDMSAGNESEMGSTIANTTLVTASIEWTPVLTQLGDFTVCLVAVSSTGKISPPLCIWLRVFSSVVYAPVIALHGNGDFPQVFNQTYTAVGQPYTVPVFPADSEIRLFSMPSIEHMEVSVVGGLDGELEVLLVNTSFPLSVISFESRDLPGHSNVIIFRGRASATAYTSALRSVGYSNTRGTPTEGARLIVVSVFDGISTNSLQQAYTEMTVTVPSRPPLVSTSGSSLQYRTTFFPAGTSIRVLNPSEAFVTDYDSPTLAGATLVLKYTSDDENERLKVTYASSERLSLPVVAEATNVEKSFGRLKNEQLVSTISDTIAITDVGVVGDLEVVVDIRHSWLGDIKVELRHAGRTELLAWSPGGHHCARDTLYRTVFDNQAGSGVQLEKGNSIPGVCRFRSEGVFRPYGNLDGFVGLPIEGEWTLVVTDLVLENDNGRLVSWALVIQPVETHLHLTTPPVVPLLMVGGADNSWNENHQKWIESDGRIINAAVYIQLAHPYTSEVLYTPTLVLTHPDGTQVQLTDLSDSFCAYGNYTYLIFDDRGNTSSKDQYIDACREFQNGNQTGNSASTGMGTVLGMMSESESSEIMRMGTENVSAVLAYFDIDYNATIPTPNYPVKSSLVDLLVPDQPLSLLNGKAMKGEWILSISSQMEQVTLLGWSLRIAREPNIDYTYDSMSHTLSFTGLDSPTNYESVLKSVMYENDEAEPSVESMRVVQLEVTDGELVSDVSLPSSETFILVHHIEINLDPNNSTNATFPNICQTFVEKQSPLHIADPQHAVLSDPSFDEGLYQIEFIIEGYANHGMEGLSVDLDFLGLVDTFVITNSTNSTTYTLLMTAIVSTPIAMLQTVLRNIVYFNNAEELKGEGRTITAQVRDLNGVYFSLIARSKIEFTHTNDAPVLILNSDLHSDSYSNIVNFVEGEGEVLLADRDKLILYDHDHNHLESVTVTIKNPYDGENDTLLVNVTGTGITAEYNSSTHSLYLYRMDTLDNYKLVLATVAYDNLLHSPGNPDTRPREICFVPDDGVLRGREVVAIVTFNSVNDPPIVDLNGEALGSDNYVVFVEEEGWISLSPDATVFDIDDTHLQYIEMQLLNPLDGPLERLSVDNVTVTIAGSSAFFVQQYHILTRSVYDVSTGILRIEMSGTSSVSDLQRVLQTLSYNNMADEPSLTTRVVRVTANDGTISGPPAYVYIQMDPVNDSPYFKPDVMEFSPLMYEDETSDINDGFSVSDIARLIGDDDPDAETGVAVVGVDATHGSWEYRLQNGQWRVIPKNVSIARGLLMSNTEGNNIRFLPDKDFNGNTTITFVAWDVSNANSSGRNSTEVFHEFSNDNTSNSTESSYFLTYELTNLDGMYANARSKSDRDPFSNTTLTILLEVVPVNDAPVIANESIYLTSIREDDYSSAGNTVQDLLKSAEDVDGVDKVGVAIVGADEDNGTWQYSTDGGQTWQDFGSPTPDAALVLSSDTRVRFVPLRDFNGVVTFGYLAWDMTDGLYTGNHSIDTTVHDDIEGSYSTQNNTAYLVVEAVNDSPVVEDGMQLESVIEDTVSEMNHGTRVLDIVRGRYVDVDEGSEVGVAVVGVDDRFGRWEYTCGSYPFRWESFIGDRVYGVVVPRLPIPEKATLLSGSCRIRFLPEDHFNTEYDYDGYPRPLSDVPYIEVRGWDNTGLTSGRSGTYGNDATYATLSHTNEYSQSSIKVTITVISENDPPILTLYNETTLNFSTTFVEDLSPVAVVGEDLTLVDNDHLRLTEANITIYGSYGTPDGYMGLYSPIPANASSDTTVPNKPPRVFDDVYLQDYCSLNGSVTRREALLVDTSQTDLAAEVVSYCPYSVRIFPIEAVGNETVHKGQFEKVLKTTRYSNTIEEPVGGYRVVEFTVSDGVNNSEPAFTTTWVETVNDAPQLDLNDFIPDINNNVLFTEGEGAAVLSNSSGLTLIDHDDNYLQYARVELLNHPDGAYEELLVSNEGTNITANYVNFTLYLEGNATLQEYTEVLKSVSYNNTYTDPGDPNESVREVRFFVSDGDKESRVAVSFVRFEGTNDVPYLDVNGNPEGQNNLVDFREEMGPVLLVDKDLVLYDVDNTTLAFATVEIVDIYDPGLEVLSIDNVTLTTIRERNSRNLPEVIEIRHIIPSVSFNSSIGLLTISGLESLDDYKSILTTVMYDNLADEPISITREVRFILYDGHLQSTPVYTRVQMIPINDSPRFNNLSVLEPLSNEDEVASMSVYDMAYMLIEDDDFGAERGIAIVDVDSANGYWRFVLDGTSGANNISVSHMLHEDLSFNRAVLLRAESDNLVQFVPNRDFVGNTSITFVAWDASGGLTDGCEKMVTFSDNGTDAFGFETRTITIQILPVNDAPVLNTGIEPQMTSIREDSVIEWPTEGDNVTLFLSALEIDVDISPSTDIGIAIIEVDNSNGVWQYTSDAGGNWTSISQPLGENRALVLNSQPEGVNRIRFYPNMNFNGESSFRYKLWDLTSDDTSGDSDVDTATDPVTGAFSMDSTTAHITVVPANSAPVATGTIHRYGSVEEDLVGYNNRHGFSVSHIASPVYRDADNRRDNGFEGCYYGFRGGIAVVDADFENGMWEYLNGTWTAFPDVSESSALLLRANVNPRIRFLPKKDYVGSATFLFKLWDLSNDYVYGSTNVNTTGSHVLTGPYSVDTVKAVLRIDPVNDPPVLHDDAQLNLIVEDLDTTANSGTTVDSLLGPVSEDVDGPKVGLAIIGIDERFGLWEYVCDNTSAWLNFKGGPPKVSEATLLLGHCRIRFIPDQNFNSEFDENGFARSESDFPYILIRSWDGYGTRYTNLRSDVDSRVDPDLVFSREIAYARIVVQGVNDPPILMLGTEKNFSSTFEEPAPPNRKVTPVSLVDPIWMTITDVDNALLSSVTFSFTRYDGFSEFVTVDTSGTDLEFNVIVDSLDFFEAVLFSSNSIASSIADYRRALIRTDYENYAEEPNATMRDIHIAIADNGLNGAQKEMDTAISGVNISLVNDSPELDLNTDIPGRHTNLQYFEGDPPLLLLAENHSLIDHDSPVLTGAVVTIVSPPDGTSEVLGVGSDSISVVHLGSRIELYGNGTPEEYSQVFSTVTYENTFSKPGNPSKATREVRFVVSDGQHASAASSAYIVFIPVNDPPEVYTDDNTRALTSTALFKEGEINGAVFRNLAVTDIDSSTLSYLEVTIKNPLDGDSERLEVREGTEIIGDASSRNYFIRRFLSEWTYFTSNSSLRMSGLSTVLEYEQILLTLRYYNSAEEPLNTTRNISITAFDGELHSKTATVFLAIQNVNDSPFFSNVLDVISPSIFEDIPLEDNHGYSLEEVAGRLILDNDRDAVKGVAIIAVDNQFGQWEYTTDFVNVTYVVEYPGANVTNTTDSSNAANDSETLTVYSANWVPLSENTSITESVLLRVNGTTTRVRFVPSKNFNGESTLRFVAWDSSDGLSDGSITDASDLSDIDPFSSDHRILTVTVNRTNDAPLLSPSISFNLTTILEDDSDSSGDPVEELLSGVSDIDLVDTEHGIAVIGVDEKYGEWQFSVDGGGSWIPMQNVSIRSAVLLHSTPPRQNRIRFVPVSDFNGYSRLTFVAWDLTNGEPSGKTNVDVLMSDPVTGPYSRNHTTAAIFVEPVNDSPVLEDGSSLLTILEDVPVDSNEGTSVGDIVNQTFYDVDADPGLNYEPNADIGIAVVGVDVRYGEWQYWCPDTSEWKVFIGDFIYGVTLPLHPRVEKATLLLSNCRIRFLPNLHFNTLKDLQGDYRPPSDVPFITIRGWDNTGRSTGESGMYARDTTYNQDSHLNEFSSETSIATINVTSVNDLPLLNISQTDSGVIFRTEFLEDSAFVYITDPPSVRLIDFDNARLDSVTVCVENSVDPDSEIIDVVGDNSTVEVTGSTVVVRLKGVVYQLQTMYTIYSNTSRSSKSSLRIMSSPGHDSAAIEAYEVLLRHLVYKNLHPEPTNGTREISFAVNDGEDVNDKVRTFVDVTLRAENRPVVMIATRTVYFTEEEASTIPLTSSDLSLTDRDHNEFFFMSGATLTFKVLPRSSLESLSVNLSAVLSSYNLVQMYFPDNGTLVVSGEAPVSQYQEALHNVLYHNLEEEPRPGHQSVCIQVTDAHGLTSRPVSVVIEVTLVNDRPPEISAPSEPYVFVEGSPFTLLQDISISDNDTGGGDLYIYQLNATISNPFDGDNEEISAMGSSNVNVMVEGFSVVLTGPATLEDFQEVLSTLKYINTAEEPNTDERYIDLVVRDANFTSDVVSVTVRFLLVNDLPVIDLNGPLSPDVDIVVNYVEGSGPQPIVDPLNLTVSDNDHQYLVSVRVELTNPYDSPLEVLSIDFTITNSTNMSTITSNTNSTSSTSITAITNSTSNTNSTNSTKIATITSNTNNTNITASTNSTGGTNITGNTKSTNIMSIYNRTTGVLTLSGWASLKDYQKVLRTLTYENMEALPGHPSAEMRIIRFVAFDGLAYSKVSTAFVKFQSVNDAPFFDLNGNLPGRDYSTSFTEEGPPVRLSSRDMMLNDVDNTSLESVTVRITNLLDGDQEVLSVPPIFSYVSPTVSTSGVLRLTGLEEVSRFREAASLVQYQNLADEPTFDQRIIEFVASDGLLDSLPYYTRVDMIPVNDPPRLQIELNPNVTFSYSSTSEMMDEFNSTLNDTALNGTMLNSTMDDVNVTVAQETCILTSPVPYAPAPHFTSYTENSPAVRLTNLCVVLAVDDDDEYLTSITITTSGVRDAGHESVFFKLDPSSDLAQKLAPYDFASCPIYQERYSTFTVSGTFTLSEVQQALQSLHYCNTDEFSISGRRTVSISAKDSKGAVSEPQFAHIDVQAVNDAPEVREDVRVISIISIDEDSNYTLPALLYFLDHEETLTPFSIQIVLVDPDVGEARVDPTTGGIVYVSALNDYGVRTVWYQACDSLGACSSPLNLTVIITPINDPPSPVPPLELCITEDEPSVLFFDKYFFDPEDDANLNLNPTIILNGEFGVSFTRINDTAVAITPAANSTDGGHLNFTVCDSDDACTNIVVNITIKPVNDKPEIIVQYPPGNDSVITWEDTPISIPVLVKDIEDRDFLNVTFVRANSGTAVGSLDGAMKSVDTNFVFKQESFVIYYPDADFCGNDVVTVRVTDSENSYCDTNISVTVLCVNDPPSFGITNLTVLEDTIVSLNLPQDLNVTDPEDVLSADSFSVVTMPQVGMLEYAGGTLVYTPPTHYHTPNGSDPVMFVLMVCDSDASNQLCVNQTISITYRSVNDAPLLPPIVVEIYEDSPYVADLASMISDVEESTVESERVELLHPLPQHGTVTYNSTTGILMYQPDPNYFGTDLIVFQACDSTDECNFNGMVNLTVLAVNDQPQAENFTALVTEDEYDLVAVYEHISDIETTSAQLNELLRLHLVNTSSGEYVDRLVSPANATLRVFDAHGIIGYDPMREFVGIDYFTYAVCDVCHIARNNELGRVELPPECLKQIEENGSGSLTTDNTNITCVEREVRVVVRNVDDVPVISDISALVSVGGSVTISPFNESQTSSPHSTEGYLYTDSSTPVFERDDLQLTIAASMGHDLRELRLNTDSDIDELSLRVFSPPSSGAAVVESNRQFPSFVYTPNPTFQGYDSFEYEVCDKSRGGNATIHCSKATAGIFVFGDGPNISSVIAISSQMTVESGLLDIDSKMSRGDKIWINFAIPTNMPPHGRAGETVSQEDIDQIFVFGTPFISNEIARMGYEGKWINDTLFELEIVDEGYPQPEIPIGQWEVRVSDGVSPCGGFDPETRNPVVSSDYCLQDAQGTSFHSTAISEPITGNFGLKLPEIVAVNIIPDTPSKKTELTKDIFLNTQIVIYLQEPLSHFQLDQYCQKDPHLLLDPSLVGQGARLTISGCQNVMPTSENAAVVYSENIARYDLPYLSNRNRRNVDEEKDRRKQDSSLTKLPSYSEITFKVVAMPTSRSMGIDSVTFADSVKEKFNIAALAEAVSATTGVPMAEYLNYSVPRPPSSHLQFEHSEATTPTIVSVRCTSDDSFFNSGDQLDIVFNRITDTPPVQNTSQIDSIFRFQPSIGTNYSGIWSDLKTLQIIIFKGSNEEISLRQFTVSFTPTYIDMTTPLLFDHADLSAGKPWCVGINVCGVKFSSLSVGVCDNYSVSCRAFEPWTGTVLLKEYKLDLLLVIAPILAFIILVTFCGIISRPVYKYFRRIHFKYKARKLDKWFWRRFDDIADMNLNQSPMCLPENEMPAAEVEGWNKNQEEIGTESVNVTSENGSEDQQGSETESAKVRIQNGKEEQCGSETESAKQEEEMGRCNQKSSENHTWNGNQYNTKVQRQTLNMNVKSRNGNEKEIVHTPQHSCETEAQATWSSPLQPERREDPFMCNVGCN